MLAALVLIPFLIWGDELEAKMSMEATVAWLRSTGSWAWAAGLGFLVIDLFLPILGTVVMSALGLVYGWFIGGLLSAFGSIGPGLLAYGLCRRLGRRAAGWLAGEEGLRQGERIFRAETGGWLVAMSRWMPLLPEVVACLAGISRMPFRRFLLQEFAFGGRALKAHLDRSGGGERGFFTDPLLPDQRQCCVGQYRRCEPS